MTTTMTDNNKNNTSSRIKDTMTRLIDLVSSQVAKDLTKKDDNDIDTELLGIMVDAHNIWQEDCHDGVDYIFDITNKKDVICLLQGDLNVSDINSIYNGQTYQRHTKYFQYGQNYQLPNAFPTIERLKEYLADNAKWIITHLFLFANTTEEYFSIFNKYVGVLFNA